MKTVLATALFKWQQTALVSTWGRGYIRAYYLRGDKLEESNMKKAKFASMLAVAGGLALATTACGQKAEEAATEAAAEGACAAAAGACAAAEGACAAAAGACAAAEAGACAAKEGACAAAEGACAAKEGACAAAGCAAKEGCAAKAE